MNDSVISWTPPQVAVAGGGLFPVRHVWCVGRNYAEHAREMGVDPKHSEPVFFAKPARAVVNAHSISYPQATREFHHEVELVVFLSEGGRGISAIDWPKRIFGYAVGVDLTRRDLQARLKKAGQPWELSKGFDRSAPVGSIRSAHEWQPGDEARIELQVNGIVCQQGQLGQMIWPVTKLLERLSAQLTLNAGDVIFTGTPAGVGSLAPGDRVVARIAGLPELEFSITQESAVDQ